MTSGVLLSACSDSADSNVTQPADGGQQQILAMNEADRGEVLRRSIRDAGYVCEPAGAVVALGPVAPVPTYKVTCQSVCSDTTYIVFVRSGGRFDVQRGTLGCVN